MLKQNFHKEICCLLVERPEGNNGQGNNSERAGQRFHAATQQWMSSENVQSFFPFIQIRIWNLSNLAAAAQVDTNQTKPIQQHQLAHQASTLDGPGRWI